LFIASSNDIQVVNNVIVVIVVANVREVPVVRIAFSSTIIKFYEVLLLTYWQVNAMAVVDNNNRIVNNFSPSDLKVCCCYPQAFVIKYIMGYYVEIVLFPVVIVSLLCMLVVVLQLSYKIVDIITAPPYLPS
jgi:hypothetical protein